MPEIRIQPVLECIINGAVVYQQGSGDPFADHQTGWRPTHWEIWDDNQTPAKMLGRYNNFGKAWRVADKAT